MRLNNNEVLFIIELINAFNTYGPQLGYDLVVGDNHSDRRVNIDKALIIAHQLNDVLDSAGFNLLDFEFSQKFITIGEGKVTSLIVSLLYNKETAATISLYIPPFDFNEHHPLLDSPFTIEIKQPGIYVDFFEFSSRVQNFVHNKCVAGKISELKITDGDFVLKYISKYGTVGKLITTVEIKEWFAEVKNAFPPVMGGVGV